MISIVWTAFILFAIQNKGESHKKVSENKKFCNIVIPSEDTKILEFNQYLKSDKASFVIYVDLEYLIKKIDGRKKIILKIHLQ